MSKNIKWKKDEQGKEYTNAINAAKYLTMAQTTFLYFYNPKATLLAQFKPEYRIIRGKKVWYREHLDKWNKQTANIQFENKKKLKEKNAKLANNTNIAKFPINTK